MKLVEGQNNRRSTQVCGYKRPSSLDKQRPSKKGSESEERRGGWREEWLHHKEATVCYQSNDKHVDSFRREQTLCENMSRVLCTMSCRLLDPVERLSIPLEADWQGQTPLDRA